MSISPTGGILAPIIPLAPTRALSTKEEEIL